MKKMDDIILIRNIRNLCLGITIAVVLLVLSTSTFRAISLHEQAEKGTVTGYITKKEVIPAYAFSFIFFRYSDTEYRIYIDYEYEGIFGESVSASKYFSVDEATYQQYHVGDYFDASNI